MINVMKEKRSVNWFGIFTQVDRIISEKHTLKNLTKGVAKIISGSVKYTKVFIVGDGGSVKTKKSGKVSAVDSGSCVDDFAALVIKKKKNVLVERDPGAFCRKHGIKPAQRNVRSMFGSPMKYQGRIYGAVILQSIKEIDAFDKLTIGAVTMIAQRLAAGIAYDRLSEQRDRLEHDVEQSCLTDPLTNMPNRRFCDLILDMEFRRAKGYTRQLSLAVVTPDNFRSISSKYGKAAGDSLLVHVSSTLKKNVRDTDFVGRYNDDEFLVLLPEAVNEAAMNAAERVRDAFERTTFAVKRLGRKKVTLSIGVVTYPSSAETLSALLEQAGKALKRAKQVGRNQVVAL
jgi:diguanylate cyclase (GGDEF)-like protein